MMSALKKAICKVGKEPTDIIEEISSTAAPVESEKLAEPKLTFKRPIDRCKLRRINLLAYELNQMFNEVKENAPIKRRRKITIYSLWLKGLVY